MNRKRRRQKGSLKKLQHRDGRLWWRLQWRRPDEKNATTKWLGQCSKMSRKAAEAERDRILEPINLGLETHNSSMMTLSEFIDTTFLEVKKHKWREDSTLPTNLGILNNHLKPALGSTLIHLITRRDLQALLNQEAEEKDNSYSLVQHLHSFMGEIFEMALADRLILVNPAPSTIIPKCKPPKEKPTMTPAEIDRVEMLLGLRDRLIFRLDTTEGLRAGEPVGLKLGDISDGRITIRRRIYRGKEGPPKTPKSKREIPLTSRTAALLAEYRKLLVDDRPEAWLFPSEKIKTPMSYSNVLYRYIKPALRRCGLGMINYQAMRRTFATQGHASGVDVKTRSDLMGNTVDVNNNVYTQTPFDAKQKAMKKLEKRLLQ
jgi:integrase